MVQISELQRERFHKICSRGPVKELSQELLQSNLVNTRKVSCQALEDALKGSAQITQILF